MNPVAALLDQAQRFLDVRETPPGSNRGVVIDFCLLNALPGAWEPFPVGVKGAPWCAGFVSLVGQLALGLTWPVPRTVSVQVIAEWAEDKQHATAFPRAGDLMLRYYPSLQRYGHIGIVTAAPSSRKYSTIEGNTGVQGSREGWGVFERHYNHKENPNVMFVRWVDALEVGE